LVVAVAVLCAPAAGACGAEDSPSTPGACLAGASAYLDALAVAPGEVLLDGTTPISDCLVEQQGPGTLGMVGKAIIDAANALNREARESQGGKATVQLGFLVGAVQQGAAQTGGIHADLVRRLDSAARFSGGPGPGLGAAFERAFGEGYAAGQANG
jgi:hypothetical protein